MFVLTMKFNKKTAVAILIAVAVVLIAIVILAGISSRGGDSQSLRLGFGSGIKTNDDRINYLSELGWECDPNPVDEQKIVIPKEFNDIFSEYNKLQVQQGFDLSQYGGLEVTLYRYEVKNYPAKTDTVLAQILVLNYQVIGGDIHSTALDGFMHGIK